MPSHSFVDSFMSFLRIPAARDYNRLSFLYQKTEIKHKAQADGGSALLEFIMSISSFYFTIGTKMKYFIGKTEYTFIY